MNLLVGFYQDATPSRTGEFVTCLQRNAANPLIDRVTVFIADAFTAAELRARFPDLAHAKIFHEHHPSPARSFPGWLPLGPR